MAAEVQGEDKYSMGPEEGERLGVALVRDARGHVIPRRAAMYWASLC